jgi:hypothetical protein
MQGKVTVHHSTCSKVETAGMCGPTAKLGRGPLGNIEYEINIIIALTTERPLLASNPVTYTQTSNSIDERARTFMGDDCQGQ